MRKISRSFGVANIKLKSFGRGIEQQSRKIGSLGGKLMNFKNLLVGSFVTTGVVSLGRELTNTLGKFQTFEAVLTNTLGSNSAAKQVLSDIQDFASKTPFQVDELTASWVKLANQGFRPSMKEMTKLGDLASSTGKGIDQLAEAVIDAQVGEFERLKEFGIRAQKEGNKVKFSFKGQTKEVRFTESAIQDYILSLGKAQGVSGSMAAISQTVAGKVSNFRDRVTNLTKTFAEALEPAIVKVIDTGSSFVSRLTTMSQWVKQNRVQIFNWVKVIGLVAGGFLSVWAASKLLLGVSAMVKTIALAWTALTGVINIGKIAVMAFNLVASLNPFSWVNWAIVGAGLLIANWSRVKKFFLELGEWMWKSHPFVWMTDLLENTFPGFTKATESIFGKIVGAVQRAFKWLSDNIFKPFKRLFENLFGFSTPDLGSASYAPKIDDPEGDGEATPVNPYGRTKSSGSRGGSGGSKSFVDDKIGGIKSTGGKNITINIDALNKGGINIHTNKNDLGSSKVREELIRMLMSVVNDVNFQS
jgi:hypothetical protein